MKAIEPPGCNVTFGANQSEYLPLPVKREPNGDVTMLFELTAEERLEIFNTGHLHIKVLPFNQPLQPILPSILPFE